jgi:phosphoribosylaminoimidazolecarboxamide formyltransferase/IMP cyclohydrolase
MAVIKQALLSVSDKTGIVEFARGLARFGVKLISTGGTARALAEAGLAVTEVAQLTGFAEMLGGRVKTLHPAVHAALLARREVPEDLRALEAAGIAPIDLVCVNLYPFAATVAQPGCTLERAIEQIDVGGPAMLRAAAKNYRSVAAVSDPGDYEAVLAEMAAANGALGLETRFRLAQKAFSHTAAYDGAISNYLTAHDCAGERSRFPRRLNLHFELAQPLRYGENPHQEAAFYRDLAPPAGTLARCRQLQGKELSYNNIADADAAWECAKTLDEPACVIVKHANPCGVAVAPTLLEAYRGAFSTDPVSAFGGIVAFNRALDGAAAAALAEQFVEVVIAPGYAEQALEALGRRAAIRVLEVASGDGANDYELKRVGGGLLVQSPDTVRIGAAQLRVVTRVQPTPEQIADLLFAWRVVKFVKSNAIVFCRGGRTLGVGAGQMSRVDAARLAATKAAAAGLSLHGSVAASDAFFPFRDGVDALAEAGARAIVQPGGSVRDEEVVAAADEHGIAMVFTGYRHFRH